MFLQAASDPEADIAQAAAVIPTAALLAMAGVVPCCGGLPAASQAPGSACTGECTGKAEEVKTDSEAFEMSSQIFGSLSASRYVRGALPTASYHDTKTDQVH